MIAKLAAALGRCLLITAGLLAIAALLLAVIAWRLIGWPYRKRRPGKLDAGLATVTALSGLAAALSVSTAAQHVEPTESEVTR